MQVPEKNRKERVWFNHLMLVSEGSPSLGWVQVVSSSDVLYVLQLVDPDVRSRSLVRILPK